MNSKSLEYLVVLVEERSFTRAATRLGITQPALSQQITRLESELGVRVIDRSSVPFVLTDDGFRVYRAAAAAVWHIRRMAVRAVGGAHRPLIVGYTRSIAFAGIPALVRAQLRASRPDRPVELVRFGSRRELERLSEHRTVHIALTVGCDTNADGDVLTADRLVWAENPWGDASSSTGQPTAAVLPHRAEAPELHACATAIARGAGYRLAPPRFDVGDDGDLLSGISAEWLLLPAAVADALPFRQATRRPGRPSGPLLTYRARVDPAAAAAHPDARHALRRAAALLPDPTAAREPAAGTA